MKIVSIVLHGNFTEGLAYQENCLPYYQKGLPGVFRHWDGIEHINIQGNMKFFYNKSVSELVELLKNIIQTTDVYEKMKTRAEAVSKVFHYSTLAVKSLGGNMMIKSENINKCSKNGILSILHNIVYSLFYFFTDFTEVGR